MVRSVELSHNSAPMTPKEKRQERAVALLEYQAARQKFNVLYSKARTISDDLSEMACWLSDAKGTQHRPANSWHRARDQKIENNKVRYRAALDFDAIVALREEIERVKATLDELEERKQELWA